MNREQIHRAFKNYDQAFSGLQHQIHAQMKSLDKMYLDHLTSRMMWDCLMGLLVKKGILTQGEFEAELNALAMATKTAMEEDAKKKEAQRTAKITVTSDVPAIPVEK